MSQSQDPDIVVMRDQQKFSPSMCFTGRVILEANAHAVLMASLAGKALPVFGPGRFFPVYNDDGVRLFLGSAEDAGLRMAKISGALLIGRLAPS
jgi:hypothetical protein